MEEIKKNIELEVLEQIQHVDVPEFLYTRIEQKINNERFNKLPNWAVYSLSFSLALIFAVNIFAMVSYIKSTKTETNLAKSMNLLPSNNIYHYE